MDKSNTGGMKRVHDGMDYHDSSLQFFESCERALGLPGAGESQGELVASERAQVPLFKRIKHRQPEK